MKTFQKLFALLIAASFLMSFSIEGTASASETAKGGEKCACISGVGMGTGTLTVKSVTVTDLFGNSKVLDPSEYTISGDASTSPSITFNNPLEANSHVLVDLTTGRKGSHGYVKMSLKKGVTTRTGTRCNC